MKKFLKLNIYAATLLMIMFSATSCLKDDEHLWDFSDNSPLVEIPEAPSVSGFIVRAIDMVDVIDINIPVNIAAPNPLGEDVTVTFELDKENLELRNVKEQKENTGMLYEMFPEALFTVDSWTVKIPAGKNLVNFPIHVKSSLVDLSKNYLLPIKIKSVTPNITIASNFSRILLQIIVKNKWDGVYEVTGSMTDPTPDYVGSYPKTIHLITTGPKSCAYFDVNLNGGTFGYKFDAAGSGSYFGNWAPAFNFNDDGTIASMSNYLNDPAPRSRRFALDNTAANKVNTDKSIDVAYHMVYNASSTRAFVIEHFTYVGPRP
jgi:hypothetical protein